MTIYQYLLYLLKQQLFVNFNIAVKALQKDSTDGLFADVVTLGASAIHNATAFAWTNANLFEVAKISKNLKFRNVNVFTGGVYKNQL